MRKLLHGADFHMDSPFSGLTPEAALERRRQQRLLPGLLAEHCLRQRCDAVVLAGDLFDSARVTPESVEALAAGLEACAVPVFIAPGNHDPAAELSPWRKNCWPGNVHIFLGGWEAVTMETLGLRVWGAAFQGAAEPAKLGRAAADGLLEVGVLHGDPVYPALPETVTREAIAESGLQYLALGHIHRPQLPLRAGHTWYAWPGVAMGRGFDETGEHGFLAVTVSDGDCRGEFLPLPGPQYVELEAVAGDDPFRAAAEAIGQAHRDDFVRLTLTGEAAAVDTEALRRALERCCRSLTVLDETVPPRSLWDEAGTGSLRGIALSRLEAACRHGDGAAADAARYLLAALEGRDAPWS